MFIIYMYDTSCESLDMVTQYTLYVKNIHCMLFKYCQKYTLYIFVHLSSFINYQVIKGPGWW